MFDTILGTITASRTATGCAIAWEFDAKQVWLADVPAIMGTKRALYAFNSGTFAGRSVREVAATIARCERDAKATMARIDAADLLAASELSVNLQD